jgi:serine acetyltransferase
VTVSGHVRIAECTFIGSGSTIANDVEIGSEVIIGVATAVTKNVGNNMSALGNPMRILDRPLRLV